MTKTIKGGDEISVFIVTDLDGTFLSSDNSVPKENIQAVQELKRKGIPVFFCTGRPVSFVEKYVKLSGVSSLVIGGNGTVIHDIFTKESLFQKCFDPQTQQRLLHFCLDKGFDTLAYRPDGGVYFSQGSERVRVYTDYNASVQKTSVPEVDLLPLEQIVEDSSAIPLCKVLVTRWATGTNLPDSKGKKDLELLSDYLAAMPSVYAVSSMTGVMDIMPHGVSKGIAVSHLADYFNLPLSSVGVVGDNQNDISMFQIAGKSVCMANGNEQAKEAASWITPHSNDQGGFVEAVEWLCNELT